MKNIHVLPTENYSPLVHSTNKYGGYFKSAHYSPMKEMGDSYQHIYITSDEEIKDGDWVLFENTNNIRKSVDSTFGVNNIRIYADKKVFKIILTTDQDLIKDGVQAIDDEFLEWFVNNPSCEEVEAETYSKKIEVETDANGYREMDVLGKEQIIDDANTNYLRNCLDTKWMKENFFYDGSSNHHLYLREEFINKCKTDSEFSEKWGLKIEERELSFNERYELCKERTNKNPLKYSDENSNYPEHIQKPVLKLMESENIPTKLITIIYNNEKIESYE